MNLWRTCVLALHHSNTIHQKLGMSQSVTNAGESQWSFDYPAVKHVIRSGNIWIRTSESISQWRVGFAVHGRWITCCSGWKMKIAEWRFGFRSVPHSRMDYSAWKKIVSCRNYVAVLVLFYSSIVSHSMSVKTLFVAHDK